MIQVLQVHSTAKDLAGFTAISVKDKARNILGMMGHK